MHKHIDLLVRADGVSHEAFVEAWRSEYVPAVEDADAVVRYHRVLPTQPEHAEFDGLSELYFETPEDRRRALGGDGGGAGGRGAGGGSAGTGPGSGDGSLPAVDEVLPVAERRTFAGEETVQRDDVGGDTDGLYKHSAFLVRKAGLDHDAFVDHWQHTHTPIAREIEGVVKYDTVLPADPAGAEFDGVAELYFANLDDLHAALGGEGSRDYDPTREQAKEAREDVDNFLAVDERPRLIGRNHLLVGG